MAGGLKITPLPAMVALLLTGATGPGYGQSDAALADPTRPPDLVEPAPAGTAAAAGVKSRGLQTVILREGQQPMAVINGVQVKLGDKLGDATLVKLNEFEAVLQGPSGREVLRMTPGIEKTSATPKPAAPQDNVKQGDKRTTGKMPAPASRNPAP